VELLAPGRALAISWYRAGSCVRMAFITANA
jgi:hypothetical protein